MINLLFLIFACSVISAESSQDIFTQIYNSNAWQSAESCSGTGSTLEQTENLRKELGNLLKEFSIKSIIDAPCGDFNWMKLVNLEDCSYFGIDIVKEVIERNQQNFSARNRQFIHNDLCNVKLPKVDLIICRDLFVHLPFKDIFRVLNNFKDSGSKYLLATTFNRPDRINKNINIGNWRTVNLEKEPFNFPKPILTINENCTEDNGIYKDKCLGLWRLDDIFSNRTPKVSIITSVYNGDKYIVEFLRNIVQQTIFDQCQLIMINANSPGDEERVIKRYMKYYPNIIYVKLNHDPGLYEVWNMAIKMAQSEFITNANLDDRPTKDSIEMQLRAIENDPEVDLVYGDFYVTQHINDSILRNRFSHINENPEFSEKNMRICLPGPHPLWRKSMHEKYGMFNTNFKYYADYEMWLRAVSKGAKFKKVPAITCLYYLNPTGVSTNPETQIARLREEKTIRKAYKYLWQTISPSCMPNNEYKMIPA